MLTATLEEMQRLNAFIKKKNLKIEKLLAKGHSSRIFLVKKGNKKLVAKIESENSPRHNMIEKEVKNLKKANHLGIGPKLFGFDAVNRVILMEFIKGKTFRDWLFEKKHSKKELKKFIEELLRQAKLLDENNLDHGQLAGAGKNILVQNNRPVIIDFEKASQKRKAHNYTVIESFLFKNKHSAITKRVKTILKETTTQKKPQTNKNKKKN